MDNSEYITAEKKKALEEELKYLQGDKRKEILDALEYAKSLGDLSENTEYHQAREEQAKLEDRIMNIDHILKNSTIVKAHHSTKVEVGSTVVVQKTGSSDKKTYQIVGSQEADMAAGKISNHSPLGMAIMGKTKGDTVTFQANAGEVSYKIIDIE
jgi:transcription elongation factor GreA